MLSRVVVNFWKKLYILFHDKGIASHAVKANNIIQDHSATRNTSIHHVTICCIISFFPTSLWAIWYHFRTPEIFESRPMHIPEDRAPIKINPRTAFAGYLFCPIAACKRHIGFGSCFWPAHIDSAFIPTELIKNNGLISTPTPHPPANSSAKQKEN